MTSTGDEPRVLECVQDYLARTFDAECVVVARPEREARRQRTPSVEAVVRVGDQTISMEHTLVEAFDEQIQADCHFIEFIEPIVEDLKRWFDGPGHLDLFWAVKADSGHKSKHRRRYQDAITSWVKKNADTLETTRLGCPDPAAHLREKPPGTPFEVRLSRFQGNDGDVYFGRFGPREEELSRLREARVRRALDEKLPKLLADARDRDGQSLLALEVNDRAFGGHTDVFDIACGLLGSDSELDWLVVVNTLMEHRDFGLAAHPDGQTALVFERSGRRIAHIFPRKRNLGNPGTQ